MAPSLCWPRCRRSRDAFSAVAMALTLPILLVSTSAFAKCHHASKNHRLAALSHPRPEANLLPAVEEAEAVTTKSAVPRDDRSLDGGGGGGRHGWKPPPSGTSRRRKRGLRRRRRLPAHHHGRTGRAAWVSGGDERNVRGGGGEVQEVASALSDAVEEGGRLDEALTRVDPNGKTRGAQLYQGSTKYSDGNIMDGDKADAAGAEKPIGGTYPERQLLAEEMTTNDPGEDISIGYPREAATAAGGEMHPSSSNADIDNGEVLDSKDEEDPSSVTDISVNASKINATETDETSSVRGAPQEAGGRKISDFAIVGITLGSIIAFSTLLDCQGFVLKCIGGYIHEEEEGGGDEERNGGDEEPGAEAAGIGVAVASRGPADRERDAKDGSVPPAKGRFSPPTAEDVVRGGNDDDASEMDASSSLCALSDGDGAGRRERRRRERERGPGCPPGEDSSTVCSMSISQSHWSSGLSVFVGACGVGGGEGGNVVAGAVGEQHASDSGISAMVSIVEGGDDCEGQSKEVVEDSFELR